jgi:hypothetical protein
VKPTHLFSKVSAAQGENLLTEALTLVLQVSRQLQVHFLKKARVRVHAHEDIEIVSQGRDDGSGKIPDLTIKSRRTDRFFILFEIKKEYKLSLKQWNHYTKIVQSRPHGINKLFAIVTPFTDVRELSGRDVHSRIWKWTDVYKIIKVSLLKETSKIAQFLLSEMLALLESKKMKPFKPLSAKELSFLQHFSETTQNVAALLNACFDNLQEASDWLIKPYPSGNFVWKSSIDANWFDKIWGSISKYVTRNEFPLGVCVTCSCESEGAFFFLYIWDEKPFAKKHFERAALKAKFEKDKDEKDDAQYLLRLSTVPDSSRTLPKTLAAEVQTVLDRVFRELTSHRSKQ